MKKRIAILGSTGSIGTQALEVIDAHPERFELEILTAFSNAELLVEQAIRFKPNAVVIANEDKYEFVKKKLSKYPVKVFAGEDSMAQIVESGTIDLVLTAIVGFAGLIPTIHAIKAGKHIALANKETLVVAGDLITQLARENRVNIFPVDSEHSAIFQCLAGEAHNAIEKIYLTASGGPFRTKTLVELQHVTKIQALKHPNWVMGAKITIDSATLMNKGLEVIEAKWLFNLSADQIDVIVHPQSIVHSIVQFEDGSMKAQMGLPDMKLPIVYAFSYPERLKTGFERFNFLNYPALTFEPVDMVKFRNLYLAYEALRKGGNMPCVINAANEELVYAFLSDAVGFLQMPEIIEKVMNKVSYIAHPQISDYLDTDHITRNYTRELIKNKH